MQTILEFSKGNWGEDRIYADDRHFIVVDGATPARQIPCPGFHSHAEWMAESFVRFAEDLFSRNDPAAEDYPSLCADFINATRSDIHLKGLTETDMPCFTTAAVYLRKDTITAYNLSDCSVILKFRDGSVRCWCDDRTSAFSAKTVTAKEKALAQGLDPAPFVSEQMARNRTAMNTPGAYWTVAYKGGIKKEFTVLSFPREEINSFLICSDGFARIFEYPGGISPEDVFTPGFRLTEALELLRSLEHSPDSPSQIKRSDDVSAILCTL